ncbi:MAG: hypothetical protein LBU44_07655 [Mediterranea sp.]|jgi:nitrogen regulatory protein PII|nr:hypothetical protein [Mediterranea sp.]
MKSVLITFDQAHYEEIVSVLDRLNCRGFTHVERVQGRGSKTGEPHYGSHAWPAVNAAVIAVVEDHRATPLLAALKEMDEKKNRLGLRAFVWNIEQSI